MIRVHHPYQKWEEFHSGMWRDVPLEYGRILLEKAVEFTGDAELYGSFMLRVVDEWPVSCEHNLTCSSLNRQAWIGHAAACIAIKCPEHITRLAWHRLSKDQQDRANAKADKAIEKWERKYQMETTRQGLLFDHNGVAQCRSDI